MKRYINRFQTSITKLPDKKQYIELITATLTVPVLATAIILNYNNLKPRTTAPTPAPVAEKIIYISPSDSSSNKTSQPPSSECKKANAPLDIASPTENEVVTDNPVSVDINYTQGSYCSSLWSYRINNGKWSSYDNKSISLYNLPSGTIHFQLRVKSLVVADEKTYSRNFIYQGSNDQVTPSLSPAVSSSSSASQ